MASHFLYFWQILNTMCPPWRTYLCVVQLCQFKIMSLWGTFHMLSIFFLLTSLYTALKWALQLAKYIEHIVKDVNANKEKKGRIFADCNNVQYCFRKSHMEISKWLTWISTQCNHVVWWHIIDWIWDTLRICAWYWLLESYKKRTNYWRVDILELIKTTKFLVLSTKLNL